MKVEPTRVHLICETKTTQFRISARIYRFPGFKLERYGTMWAPPSSKLVYKPHEL